MTLQLFNLPYFVYVLFALTLTLGLWFIFKNKSRKVKWWVVMTLLILNVCLHYLKCLFPPYNTQSNVFFVSSTWPVNLSAVIVFIFPIIFLSKSKSAKDFMFVLGVLSGSLTVLYPSSRFGNDPWVFDTFRFYLTHIINYLAPLLMVAFGLHELNYKNFLKSVFYTFACFALVMISSVIMSETGITRVRGDDFFNPKYSNGISLWFPAEGDLMGQVLDIFCPKFLKTVWTGQYAGSTKYVPLLWTFPGIFVCVSLAHLLLILPIQFRHNIAQLFKKLFKRKQKYEVIG